MSSPVSQSCLPSMVMPFSPGKQRLPSQLRTFKSCSSVCKGYVVPFSEGKAVLSGKGRKTFNSSNSSNKNWTTMVFVYKSTFIGVWGLTQSKMKRGGTRQDLLTNKSTYYHEVVQGLAFLILPGSPSLLPQGTFPSMKPCRRMALGYWWVSSCHPSLCSPCKAERSLGMKIWGPCLLGHPCGGNGKVSHPYLLCPAGLHPSLGPCIPDYMKDILACLTWHRGKSRNSYKNARYHPTQSAAISPTPTV